MTLQDWITEVGGPPAAAHLLNCSVDAAYRWFRRERVPTYKFMRKMIRLSNERLAAESIYLDTVPKKKRASC